MARHWKLSPSVRYTCRERGRTHSCVNVRGDGFRYTFPRILECGSNLGAGWTVGTAQGAGKYDLTTWKVQCPQVRGFVDELKYGRPFRTRIPPDTPAIITSGIGSSTIEIRGLRPETCEQPYSATNPIVPITYASHRPKRDRSPAREPEARELDPLRHSLQS